MVIRDAGEAKDSLEPYAMEESNVEKAKERHDDEVPRDRGSDVLRSTTQLRIRMRWRPGCPPGQNERRRSQTRGSRVIRGNCAQWRSPKPMQGRRRLMLFQIQREVDCGLDV